jgi:hypothetical protein
VFNVDGTLATQSSSVDSKKPAALQNIYSGTPSRLTQIKDPVSGRAHTLYYNTDNSNKCYGGATAPPSRDPTAPPQMLCRITYWDGSETRLWYSGQTVARIENPGSNSEDYGYSSTTGPLTAHRSGLAADWVAAAAGRDTHHCLHHPHSGHLNRETEGHERDVTVPGCRFIDAAASALLPLWRGSDVRGRGGCDSDDWVLPQGHL